MYRYSFLFISLLFLFSSSVFSEKRPTDSDYQNIYLSEQHDSLQGNQVLYNGRLWRNLYLRVRDNQFLFSNDFLQGSVSIGGNEFKGLYIKYDIYNDEIIIPGSNGAILQLNKELVDSFTFTYQLKNYRFAKITEDSVKGFFGYVNILYSGKSTLYIKYRKEIDLLAVDDKYDKFFQISKIYLIRDGVVHLIKNRRYLLKNMEDHEAQVKEFIKKNKIIVSKKNPDSFIPLVRYYDTLHN
jgi:hypothetical protein